MKLKHGIILLTLGLCMEFVGGLMKTMHQPFAVNTLMLATVIKIAALFFITFKLLSFPALKEILNK